MLPECGAIAPVSIRMVVVFPLPFGPRKPKISPRATSKSMPSTAVKSPKRLVSPRTETAVSAVVSNVGEAAGVEVVVIGVS